MASDSRNRVAVMEMEIRAGNGMKQFHGGVHLSVDKAKTSLPVIQETRNYN